MLVTQFIFSIHIWLAINLKISVSCRAHTQSDDLVIFAKTVEIMQAALDALLDYCNINDLEVNVPKSKVIKFSQGGRYSKTCTNNNLEFVSLGNYITILARATQNSIHISTSHDQWIPFSSMAKQQTFHLQSRYHLKNNSYFKCLKS